MEDGLILQNGAWNPTRCFLLPASYHTRDAYGGGRGIPVAARDLIRRGFTSLTEPTPDAGSLITWGLADCIVDGRWSMAILAQIENRAYPFAVIPTPGMILRNWCGDELSIVERPIMRHPEGSHHEMDYPEDRWSSAARMAGLTRAGLAQRPRT